MCAPSTGAAAPSHSVRAAKSPREETCRQSETRAACQNHATLESGVAMVGCTTIPEAYLTLTSPLLFHDSFRGKLLEDLRATAAAAAH